ncbi:hypothetical protein AJ85_20130 [Alkalihalobacillus alcalophilus ATCC 27647 = CGMCC 1.3604]|uniref:HTH cro/C1-type domain-containing protein n=1 Tax=Alkalihalobacillus alcalophilus ATCC 27647 = CGMCC 1.3604 TaxID=1218173 RepID=A0A4S4JWH4_ALKAL|nr:helix-turn-helix transcriptional regulator [Alkalihalobacillus alcalophilus]YP_009276807.1 transcriptional repressor [Bacillus phage BalMu-1]AJA42435.1 hypothetical protein BalMu1_A1 [Bacillus phage BalMu-1]MED1561236.1 helix-turn-helix transcriptional regulator [Alkalihalobacillus alcalophilus]THG89000.1 hypothetical protein AJ85_20130 [Alkalihalobacillus alcalophilus ATCC 27647 = CGMCC 1.3604]
MKSIDNIGVRIKYLREKNGLSQAAFAKRIEVSAGNVGDWESEKKKSLPGAKAIHAISGEFGVSADWLLTGEEYIGHSISENGNILTQSDMLIIDKVVAGGRFKEPEMTKRVMKNVVSNLRKEGNTEEFNEDDLVDLLKMGAALYEDRHIQKNTEEEKEKSIELSGEAQELVQIFNSLSDRDAIELMTIARMKRDLTVSPVKRGTSSKSTSKTESVTPAPEKKHA